jgi:Rad3-related DNA helicase
MKDYIQENFKVSARKGQNETIQDTIEAFDSGYKNVIIDADTGSGKQIAHDTPVLTINGWSTHGKLQIGDYVFGIDGNPKEIINISEETECNMKITFRRKNGNNISDFSFYTHENHIWVLQKERKNSPIKQFSTKDLLNENLWNKDKTRGSKTQKRMRFWLPQKEPLNMNEQSLLIDPYWLGLWLGDGTKNKPLITQQQEDVDEWINTVPYEITSSYFNGNGSANAYEFRHQNILKNLRKLNLFENKHIPEIYKQASIEQRLELVAGLIDSDGHRKDNNRYAFDNNNIQLVKDIKEVLISLGFIVSKIVTIKNSPRDINGDGNLVYFKDTYRIVFNPKLQIPCRLQRHIVKRIIKPRRLGLYSVEYVDTDKMGKCIEVEDGIYLIGKELIPTHNSYIAIALAKHYNNSYIYTPQKLLQDQYGREFPEIPILKGRSNYPCVLSNKLQLDNIERFASSGLCIKRKIKYYKKEWVGDGFADTLKIETEKCPGGRFRNEDGFLECHRTKNAYKDIYGQEDIGGWGCEYLENKSKAVQAPVTILNYDYGLYELNFAKELPFRKIAIHDEAHNLESKIMNFVQLELATKRLGSTFAYGDISINNRLDELSEAHFKLQEQIDDNETEIEKLLELKTFNGDMQADNLMDINKKLTEITEKITRTHELIQKEPENWITKYENGVVIFKPILIHDYAQDYLLKHTELNVFMSGTIISPSRFSEWLGLEKVGLSNLMGHFPKEIRPVELSYCGSFSRKNFDETIKIAIPVINKILDLHENEKGIIHTNSFKITNEIRDNISNDRLIYHDGERSQYDLIDEFTKSNEPLVLVSPSVKEGLDLKDDLGRFQIIAKVPYPYLGDAQILARKDLDEKTYNHGPVDYKWYVLETIKDIVQSAGRIVRHREDFGKTYILDSDFNRLYGPKSALPYHFQQAIMRKGKFENETQYQLTEKPMRLRKQNKLQIIENIERGNNTLEKIFNTAAYQSLETYNGLRVTIQDLLADEYIEVI